MSIRPSSSADVARLLTELASGDPQRRDLAVARLAVIGPRALTPLLALAGDASRHLHARMAAFEVLEAIGDSRALAVSAAALAGSSDELAVAAIGVLGPIARGTDARATKAFDRLAALATSADVATSRRLAALAALEGQPESVLKPLYTALSQDPASRVVARVTRRQTGAVEPLETLVTSGLPADPRVVAAVARDDGEKAPLKTLTRAIELVRAREARASDAAIKNQWTVVRGVLHQHLAARGSRLAVYDLRETLEAATGPLPVGFLSAAAVVGDVRCLVPLARAWVDAPAGDRWWRDHLAEAFRAIVTREALTRRHPTLKQILEKWPSAGVLVAAAKLR
jgi:hypothetical protein